MNKIRTFMESLTESVTMPKKEKLMTVLLAALTGALLGMLFSPRKNICCGNGNGNYYGTDEASEEE